MVDITLILPGCGINYLWQLGGIKALTDLGISGNVKHIYASSGGVWTSIFFGMGKTAMNDWANAAPKFYSDWQKKNRFSYIYRATDALRNDSKKVLGKYGFFSRFKPGFKLHVKLTQIYPKLKTAIIDAPADPKRLHSLALASSTIPFITGTAEYIDGEYFVDGGLKYGFSKEQIKEKNIISFEHNNRNTFAKISIRPKTKLPSGLALGSPFLHDEDFFKELIQQGYRDFMRNKKTILNLANLPGRTSTLARTR